VSLAEATLSDLSAGNPAVAPGPAGLFFTIPFFNPFSSLVRRMRGIA